MGGLEKKLEQDSMSRYFFTSILVSRRGFAKVRILKKILDLGHFGRSFWVILGGFLTVPLCFPYWRGVPGAARIEKIIGKKFSGACQIFVLGHPGMPPACSRASARPLRARATSRCPPLPSSLCCCAVPAWTPPPPLPAPAYYGGVVHIRDLRRISAEILRR